MNFIGFKTLFMKEVSRSKDVAIQAFLSPVITTLLYFLVFGSAIGHRIGSFGSIPYDQFIVPGLILMALIMNSLMAASSGIYFPRFIGTIGELLTAPLSGLEIVLAYALAAVARSLAIGATIYIVAYFLTGIPIANPFFVLLFGFLTALTFAFFGLVLGIWAKDFEQLSLVPTLLITPLSFLGGIFYSLDMLPAFWQNITLWNPIFYMVDGLRYGFFGVADVNPWISIVLVGTLLVACLGVLQWMFRTGYKLKN